MAAVAKAIEGLGDGDGGGVMGKSAVERVGKALRIRKGEGLRTG